MCASSCAVTVRDLHNLLPNTDAGAYVKRWLQCGGRGSSVLRCVGSEVDCTFVPCFEEVKYEKALSTLVLRFNVQPLPENGPSLVVFHCIFNRLYFAERISYSERDSHFEVLLRCREQRKRNIC